jgi:hypothetical protein
LPVNFGAVRLGPGSDGEPTPLVTLDSLKLPACRLLKIDVEGMDFEVLVGATATVARTRPFIYMEAKTGPGTEQAIAWLQERAYRCYWHFATFFCRDNHRQVAENVFGGQGDINLLAVPSEQAVQVRLPLILGPTADWQRDYQAFLAGQGR